MSILHSLDELAEELSAAGKGRRIVIALGVFDGVHLGHQSILKTLVEKADELNAVPVVLFFSPHPRELLFPPGPRHLSTVEYRSRLLETYGASYVVAMPFTRELADLGPFDFLDFYFGERSALDVRAFCVGENWHFGRGNKAGTAELESWAASKGREASIVPCLSLGDELISSSRIRKVVEQGNLEEAASLLGRPFEVEGIVSYGIGLARALDCPTANIVDERQVFPPSGVYAASASWDGRSAFGIVYVGNAPTIEKHGSSIPWLELHLFDCSEELYGKRMVVTFRHFIRAERRFASPEALAQQIKLDIDACLQYR